MHHPRCASLVLAFFLLGPALAPGLNYARAERAEPELAIATDPVALINGRYAVSAAAVVSPRVAVRGNVERGDDVPGIADSDSWEAGISLPIYLDRALHGPFIEPGFMVARQVRPAVGIGVLGSSATIDMSVLGYLAVRERTWGPQIFVGWQWMLASRVHAAVAIGASQNWSASGSGTSATTRESYLRVGFAW